jgi:hypothetical protein
MYIILHVICVYCLLEWLPERRDPDLLNVHTMRCDACVVALVVDSMSMFTFLLACSW